MLLEILDVEAGAGDRVDLHDARKADTPWIVTRRRGHRLVFNHFIRRRRVADAGRERLCQTARLRGTAGIYIVSEAVARRIDQRRQQIHRSRLRAQSGR